MDFTSRLLQWYQFNQREFPWRNSGDPYKIWLSEIILQQTRVVQGMVYYYRFLDKFPTIQHLANSSEDQVLSLWQGLGYYSRARNLHATAKEIVFEHNGNFPTRVDELLKLKGIGPYTAAAIASMAFDSPVAAVDGNVLRVISRFYAIEEPVDNPLIHKEIKRSAQLLLDESNPGEFNQALMDFGAMVCKPSRPLCNDCPFFIDCLARIKNKQEQIPRKKGKIKVKKRFFHFLYLFHRENNEYLFFIEKREKEDIWKNLFQLPLVETNSNIINNEILIQHPLMEKLFKDRHDICIQEDIAFFTHKLTHQHIQAFFYSIPVSQNYSDNFAEGYTMVSFDKFTGMGKPVLISKYLDKKMQNR